MSPDRFLNPTRIIEMTSAFFDSCVLFTASDLGVFGTLEKLGLSTSETIARELGLDPRGSTLLLDACVTLGLVEKSDNSYRNTAATSLFLVPGSPGDLSQAIRYNRDVYGAWGKLASFVREGRPVERPQLHLGDDPDRTRTFVLSMHHRAMAIGSAVVSLLELTGRRQLLDVGGGPGAYSVLIAQANPEIRCTVLDLPAVARIAGELIEQAGASDRVKILAGDYHTTPFPIGNDIVNFFGVLHQESPASIQDLFRRAFESMVPGAAIYVMDMMTDGTHTSPKYSTLFALNMALTTNHGWVFSDAELKGWIEGAGFVDFAVRPLPPPMPHWLVSARRPL